MSHTVFGIFVRILLSVALALCCVLSPLSDAVALFGEPYAYWCSESATGYCSSNCFLSFASAADFDSGSSVSGSSEDVLDSSVDDSGVATASDDDSGVSSASLEEAEVLLGYYLIAELLVTLGIVDADTLQEGYDWLFELLYGDDATSTSSILLILSYFYDSFYAVFSNWEYWEYSLYWNGDITNEYPSDNVADNLFGLLFFYLSAETSNTAYAALYLSQAVDVLSDIRDLLGSYVYDLVVNLDIYEYAFESTYSDTVFYPTSLVNQCEVRASRRSRRARRATSMFITSLLAKWRHSCTN